jgi:hypothetical protein
MVPPAWLTTSPLTTSAAVLSWLAYGKGYEISKAAAWPATKRRLDFQSRFLEVELAEDPVHSLFESYP